MKFIHISDVHLGAKPDRGRLWSEKREQEIDDSFLDIIRLCEEEQIDLLLIAGDLFDTIPTERQLKTLDMRLRRLSVTKTVIIAGASDYIGEGSAWEGFDFDSDTVVLPKDRATNAYLKDLNVCITGFSYGKPEYTERLLERMKPGKEGAYNILLGYGGDRTHMPFSKERLARLGFDYIALGHIHKPQHILKNKMAFSGCLEPVTYHDTGRRGYILGEVDNEQGTRITWVPFNKTSYVNMALDVNIDNTNEDISAVIEEQINHLGNGNIYRILLRGRIANDLELNLSALTKRYYVNEIIDNTERDYDVNELFVNNQDNLVGRFIDRLADDEDDERHELHQKALLYGIEAMLKTGDS